MSQPSPTRRSAGALIPGLLVSGVAIVALVAFVDVSRTVDALATARPGWLAAGAVVFLVALTGRAAASRELVDGRTGLGGAFTALVIGYLASNVLPLRAGEAVRAVVLGRKTGTGVLGGATAVAAERMLDVIIAATVLLAGLAAVGAAAPWAPAAAAGVVAMAGMTVLVVFARKRQAIARWLEPKLAGRPLLIRLLPKLITALEGLARPKRLARGAVILGASWILAVVFFWIVLRAFVPDAPVAWAAVGLGVMAFGIALPSSPGSVGLYEAAWVGGLSLCGADPSEALAFAVAAHAITLSGTSICGLIALSREVGGGRGFAARAREILTGRTSSAPPSNES